jgi:hypothetical protein
VNSSVLINQRVFHQKEFTLKEKRLKYLHKKIEGRKHHIEVISKRLKNTEGEGKTILLAH